MALLALGGALCGAPAARAFHAGGTFDKPPGAGGGGGLFYAGTPLEHGWDCTTCHTGAEGRIRVNVAATPAALFDKLVYAPGQSYDITVTLLNEHLGFASPRANFNSLAASAVDGKGQPAGRFSGYAPEVFYSGGPATIVSAGQKVAVTQWTFRWTAPDKGTGRASFHFAAVDGNGADGGPGSTLTDPFGDDVIVGALDLDESTLAAKDPLPPKRPHVPKSRLASAHVKYEFGDASTRICQMAIAVLFALVGDVRWTRAALGLLRPPAGKEST